MNRLMLSLGYVMVLAAPAWAAAKDSLFVAPFGGKGVSADEADTVAGSACTAATQDGRFVVKCRDTASQLGSVRELQSALGYKEGAATKDDCGPEGCLAALGKAAEAKWVLGGTVAKVGEKQFLLTVTLVEPVSGTQMNRVEEKVAGDLSVVIDRVPGVVRRALAPPAKAAAPAAQPAPAPAPAKK